MTEKTPKYMDPIVIEYKITLETGLHIWGSKGNLKIGWIDSEVVKHPLTNEPYIPGSSIKWRMRALLEMVKWVYDNNDGKYAPTKYNEKEDPNSENNKIAKAFGCAGKKVKIASRILVEDFRLVVNDKVKEYCEVDENNKIKRVYSDFYEDKAENYVPRFLSWDANPRNIERVPAWLEFKWRIVLTPVEWWDYPISKEELESILKEWIELIENFWLWWGVSRRNWRVKFEKIEEK